MDKGVFYLGIGSVTVALIAVLAMTPTDQIALQTTVQTYSDDTDSITTHEEWIEWYRNVDPDELGHGHNEIVRDTWVAQYEFEQEFHPEDGLVVEYLSALVIQKEMLQDTYDYADEKLIRYHEWLLGTFDVPSTLEGVKQAMLDLVGGNESNLYRIDHVHYHNQRAIMIAEPPFDLWESDPDWWWLQNELSACQYEEVPDCDEVIWADENNRPLTEEELELLQPDFDEAERQWRADKEARDDDDYYVDSIKSLDFLPPAEAATRVDKYNTLKLRVSASECDASRCTFRTTVSGTGSNDASSPNPTRHVVGDANVGYQAWVRASDSENALTQGVSVSGEIEQPETLCSQSSTGTLSASISCSENPSGRDHVFRASAHSSAYAYYN